MQHSVAGAIVFVAVKQIGTNLTGIHMACICKELVYKNGTIAECVIENRGTCGDLLP